MKKSNKKVIIFSILIVVSLAIIGGGVYLWRNSLTKTDNSKGMGQPKPDSDKVTDVASSVVTTVSNLTTCDPVSPGSEAVDSIQNSISAGDGSAIQGYLGDNVMSVLAASEAAGLHSAFEAMGIIASFISGTEGTWNFALGASELSSYGHSTYYGQYFGGASIVGISASTGKMISLSFNCDSKISTVFMVNSIDTVEW